MRPIDADTLKEIIGECPENWADSPEEIVAFNMWHRVMDDIDSTPTIGGWISVNERLPENGQFVVVRHRVEGRIYSEVAHYIMDLWWLDWDSNGLELNAISWIPLPEPPEGMKWDE